MRTLLSRFSNIHSGETGVIIGNGPSLTLGQLEKLSKYPTFGSNQIFRLPYTPTYFSMADREMIDACIPLPADFKPKEMFIRAEYGIGNPIYPISTAGFTRNIDNFIVLGGTITYVNIQIAYYMGFTTLLLVGVDHSYPKAGQMTPGKSFVAGENDPDHFKCVDGSPYFTTGKCYNAPELERTTISYNWAKEFFGLEGRRIVNLTPDSKLDVFEKMDIDQWLTQHST